jgi:aspartate racemase
LKSGGVLGIIGGLGPRATVFYYEEAVRLHREWWGSSPRLLVYSLPLEEMCSAVKRGSIADVEALLREGLEALASAGASVVIVAANTPHVAWDGFRRAAEALGVRAVSIYEPAAEEALRRGYRRVGIIATSATLKAGFYQEALRQRGIEAIVPSPEVQAEVDEAIEGIAFEGPTPARIEALSRAVETLGGMGAEAVVVACTDVSPYTDSIAGNAGIPLLDASIEHIKTALKALGPR